MSLEMTQKFDHLEAFDTPRVNLAVETPSGQPTDDREAFPVEGLLQHRRLPTRSPSPRPGRSGAQSAFVNENDSSPLLAGLFFKAGHFTRFQ